MSYAIELADISHHFGGDTLFSRMDLSIGKGELWIITGLSGTGKSTLLEIIAGVIEPAAGSVKWNGVDVNSCSRQDILELERKSSVVFQQHALLSYLPLFENIALPLRHHQFGTAEVINAKVAGMVERLKLTKKSWSLPETLSVGERRLGSIARALVVDPGLICMDEPTEGLDEVQKELFMELLLEQIASEDVTIVITTNDTQLQKLAENNVINLDHNRDDNENETE